MYAGRNITVHGTVEARGSTTGGHGGAITLDACCSLLIGDTGIVSSRGQDPGPSRVHLEACLVNIFGLVQSTGPAHSGPEPLCAPPERPTKPANSSGCVEIWSGTDLTIDATGTHHAEVHADVGFSGGTSGLGWVDLLANGNILINDGTGNDGANPAIPSPATDYAVHANMGLGNGHGGIVTVQSKSGSDSTFGLALQANDTANGAHGGTVIVEAGGAGSPAGDVAFNTASIQAVGSTGGGGTKGGGTIAARSFNGDITGTPPGSLNANGGPPAGSITLTSCLGPSYTGASTPAAVPVGGVCGGTPTFPSPADTLLPAATCCTFCQPVTFTPTNTPTTTTTPTTPTPTPTPTQTPGQLPVTPKDATILHGNQNTNNGANYTLRVLYQTSTIVGFDATGIVPGSVTSAYLVLHVQNAGLDDPPNSWPGGAENLIKAYRLNDGFENWAEGNGFNFPTVVYRGDGPGVTWNCVTDSNIANNARDCSGATFWDNGGQNVQGPVRSIAAASPNLLISNNMADGSEIWFDVTADVQAGLGPKDSKFMSWFVRKPSGAGFVSFYSREGAAFVANPAYAPRLAITP